MVVSNVIVPYQRRPPSVLFICLIALLLGIFYKALYQLDIIIFLMGGRKRILQAARQSGKTFLTALIITAYVVCGCRVIILLPTLKQGSRLIFRQVRLNIKHLEKFFPAALSHNPRGSDEEASNQGEILCANGGQVVVLSSDEFANREGYTCDLVVIDEAHKAKPIVLADISPTLNVARETKQDRTILLGIGGFRRSLITTARTERGFVQKIFDCWEILKSYPPFQNVIDEERETLTEIEFQQQYECKDVASGEMLIFPVALLKAFVLPRGYDKTPQNFFGIDVGKIRNMTLCVHVEKFNDVVVVGDYFEQGRVSYFIIAANVIGFMMRFPIELKNIIVELNGPGHGFLDIIERVWNGVRPPGITMNAKRKHRIIVAMQKLAEEGKLVVTNKVMRQELESLTMELDDFGNVKKYEHSDHLSALICALSKFVYNLPSKQNAPIPEWVGEEIEKLAA